MNALILAAGYATRLYPLTLDKAKPLLPVGGKPIIEWVVDKLIDVPDLESVYIVTNDKFANDFQAWAERYQSRQPKLKFKIINDGSKSDDDKLGAIGDINFVVTRQNLTESDLLIVAGDNLFSESLAGFVGCAKKADATVAVYDVGDAEAIKKYGNIADQPGRFVQWLYGRTPVKTFQLRGKWLDIGSKETLKEADEMFRKVAP